MQTCDHQSTWAWIVSYQCNEDFVFCEKCYKKNDENCPKHDMAYRTGKVKYQRK